MRNVVVICLDTVRKDYFDNYALRLKDKSDSTFNQCRAASSWTTPSHGSMFSGELPHQHHVHAHDRKFDKLNQSETFLTELSNEYTTIGLSANVHAGPAFGFESLFDKFSSVTKQSYFQDGLDIKSFVSGHNQTGIGLYQKWLKTIARHEYPVKSFFNGLIKRLDSLSAQSSLPKLLDDGAKRITRHTKSMIRGSTEPIFAFLNLMDAHPPLQHTYGYDNTMHDVPNSWSSLGFDYWEIRRDGAIEKNTEDIQYFKAIYRTAIDYLDRVVTGLISDIHSITNCETTVIVTADHGEDLGDSPLDSSFGHTGSLSEGLLHVPLELYNPPQGYKSVYDNLVSHLDLAQLIVSIADESDCDISRTVAPAEIIGGLRIDQDWPLSEDEFQYWNRMIRCAYRNKTKVVWDSQGRVTEHQLNPKQASSEQVVDVLSSVPTYAQNLFKHDIENYKRHAREMETSSDRIDESTRD